MSECIYSTHLSILVVLVILELLQGCLNGGRLFRREEDIWCSACIDAHGHGHPL